MKIISLICFLIVYSTYSWSQYIDGGTKLILDHEYLYIKQDKGKNEPPILWKYGETDNTNERLWISSLSQFNNGQHLWDIADDQILTYSIMNLKRNNLRAFHLTSWDSLHNVNKQFLDKTIMSARDNWPIDIYRLIIGDEPLKGISRSLLIKEPIFMDLYFNDDRVEIILFNSESGLISNWLWADNIGKLSRFGAYFGFENPSSVEENNSTKWQLISELKAPENMQPPFILVPKKSKIEYMLIDNNMNSFILHPGLEIVQIDMKMDSSTLFVMDKNERQTYFVNSASINNLTKQLSNNRNSKPINLRESIKNHCQFVY